MTTGASRATVIRRATWAPWSPAQFVIAILGGFFIVLGVLVLADSGVDDWVSPQVTIWGLAHTPLMAVIEIGVGLLALMAARYPYSSRTTLFGFGTLMAVVGVLTLIEPELFGAYLGANRQMGVFYTVAGVASAAIGSIAPVIE